MNRILLGTVYGALALAYIVFFRAQPSVAGACLKATPILLLAAAAWREAAPGWRAPLALALLFSAAGDVLLDLEAIRGGLFTTGLGSFLLAQLLYAARFWTQRGMESWRRRVALAYLPVAFVLAWVVLPRAGAEAVPVAVYLAAITAMVTGAAMADRPLTLFAGALAFALSDSLIALNRFVLDIPFASICIMLSYYLAQWLIWHGAAAPRATSRAGMGVAHD